MAQYANRHSALELKAACGRADEAVNVLRETRLDLLLLDIDLPDMSGLELAAHECAETMDPPPDVVLITASEEYAVDAFDLDVTDYLVKPVRYARFLTAINRVEERRSASSSGRNQSASETADDVEGRDDTSTHTFLKSEGRLVRVSFADIQFVEAKGDYMLVCTSSQQHMVNNTMKELQDTLPSDQFVRVHRSYLVRLDQIEEIDDDTAVVGGAEVPVSPSRREDLEDAIQTL